MTLLLRASHYIASLDGWTHDDDDHSRPRTKATAIAISGGYFQMLKNVSTILRPPLRPLFVGGE